ncbi:MAG: hypothetical protein ACHQJD_07105 [Thermoanaerobaculia bacterium]
MRMTLSAAIVVSALVNPSAGAASSAKEVRKEILPFIADDYPRALAAARAQGKPIFLEAWAPW